MNFEKFSVNEIVLVSADIIMKFILWVNVRRGCGFIYIVVCNQKRQNVGRIRRFWQINFFHCFHSSKKLYHTGNIKMSTTADLNYSIKYIKSQL